MARWVGVDVGGKRKGFDAAVIGDRQVLELRGGLTCQQVVDLVTAHSPAAVAIDSPCACAPDEQTCRDDERQLAKSICGIRWTPDSEHVHASPYYAWICEGFALFEALSGRGAEVVIEVFPTASWTRWLGKRGSRTRAAWTRQGLAVLGLDGIPDRTNQDQRDAIAAAVTARQHSMGMTEAIGDIVVPLPSTSLEVPRSGVRT